MAKATTQSVFGRYLEATGTSQHWLAVHVHVSDAKVCRWAQGASMSPSDRQAVLEVLRERASLDLDGLFLEQNEWALRAPSSSRPRQHVGSSPFERILAALEEAS